MKEGASILIDIIQNHFKGWYVLDTESWKDWWSLDQAIVIAHTEYLVDVLMGVDVYPDTRNYKDSIITVSVFSNNVGQYT